MITSGESSDSQKFILPHLNPHVIKEFLLNHFNYANLRQEGNVTENVPDLKFDTNHRFWNSVIREQTRALKWIQLNGFCVIDWYPRSPGIFHTDNAERHRERAQEYVRVEEGIRHYEPYGKVNMIEGGVGSVRFKPINIEGEACWLCTATADEFCHTGIPIAVPNRLMEEIGFDSLDLFELVGQARFLPDSLLEYFGHWVEVPQLYILLDSVKKLNRSVGSKYVTPMVYFEKNEWQDQGHHVTYVTCQSNSSAEIDNVKSWLDWYTDRYGGEIVTNFDQQRPTYQNAPFSLQNVMEGRISEGDLRKYGIRNAPVIVEKLISTGGGAYVEGDVNAGRDFIGRDRSELDANEN